MSAASRSLRDLQQAFRDIGINDDVRIAGYVAFLLLIKDQWDELLKMRSNELVSQLPELHQNLQRQYPGLRHIPEPPPVHQWDNDSLPRIVWLLSLAYQQSPHNHSPAHFFQREIRFELLKSKKGSQYPTPHHLAAFMAALAISGTFIDVIDLAAGSSGLLAAAHELINDPNRIDATGVDYDPAWSALGASNLLLHDPDPGATFVLGSGISFHDSRESHYSAALLNPPFSGSRSQGEVWDSIHTDQYGTANANVLTVRSLQLLRAGGRAAILLPSGVLFGSGTNANLRAHLIEHYLEAVITLDRECFQPFSHVAAHLLVVEKLSGSIPPPRQPVWMCNVAHDGYPTGAGRDLTEETNPKSNELPRVRELLLQSRKAWSRRVDLQDTITAWATLLRQQDGVPGAAIRVHSADEPIRWQVHDLPSGALVEVCDNDKNTLGIFSLPYRQESTELIACTRRVSARQEWRTLLTNTTWADALPIQWRGNAESTTVTITAAQAGKSVQIQAGTGSSKLTCSFAEAGTSQILACILDGQGTQVSPWLYLQENIALHDSKHGKELQAFELVYGTDAPHGWLIQLNENVQDQSTQQEVRSGWLLITFQPETLFYGNQNHTQWALRLRSPGEEGSAGWLCYQSSQSPSLQIGVGPAIRLRDEVPTVGLAIGPAVGESDPLPQSTVFGVLVPHTHLAPEGEAPRSFEPRNYLPEPPPAPVAHPSEVIAAIRKNQSKLSLRVDGLLKMLGSFTAPRIDDEEETLFSLASLLDPSQQQIVEMIRSFVSEDGRPRLFTIDELREKVNGAAPKLSQDSLNKSLMLFVRLGLLVEVHVNERNGYRLVQQSDVVKMERRE
ncbi:MAG: N-6 DNA methylase [Caldilineaceae bacterium]